MCDRESKNADSTPNMVPHNGHLITKNGLTAPTYDTHLIIAEVLTKTTDKSSVEGHITAMALEPPISCEGGVTVGEAHSSVVQVPRNPKGHPLSLSDPPLPPRHDRVKDRDGDSSLCYVLCSRMLSELGRA